MDQVTDFFFGSNEGLFLFTLLLGIVVIVIFIIFRSSETEQVPEPVPTSDKPKPVKSPPVKPAQPKAKEKAQVHPLQVTVLKGHTDDITSCSFSPDGKSLVSTSRDRTMRLYKTDTLTDKAPTYIRINTSSDYPLCSAWSNDSHHVFICLENSQDVIAVKIFSRKNEEGKMYKEVFRFHHGQLLTESIDVSTNSKFIITCNESEIKLWTLKGVLFETINTNQPRNNMACFSPDCRFIAAATWGAEAKLYEIKYKKSENQTQEFDKLTKSFDLKGHKTSIFNVCFSSGSDRAATTSKDGTWKLFNTNVRVHLGEEPKFLYSVENPVPESKFNLIAISPDSKLVAVTSKSNLYFYDIKDGKLITQIDRVYNGDIGYISWHTRSQQIAVAGDMGIKIFKSPLAK